MRDTDWLATCGWGAFCHYLTSPETTADAWNRQVDAFDVEALATQLASAGVPYFFITQKGGVITWDVPIDATGRIPEPFVRQLAAIRTHLDGGQERDAAAGREEA
jgi:hypothetical protein